MEENKERKKSFCRFYLRGLCIYNSHQCDFSHGVWDLNYDYYHEGEEIEYDYHKKKDDKQKNTIKGPAIYKSLFDFQVQKVFSLQELNQNRPYRVEIRNLMYQQLYQQFMELLEIKYPGTDYTQTFLLREYTRVGFNKTQMGTMKFNHIVTNLCEAPGSKYFKMTKAVPPQNKKQTVIVRKAHYQDIIKVYQQEYNTIMKKSQKALEENVIKKELFTAVLPEGVPPLNQILKDQKSNFADFISKVLKQDTSKIIFEASVEAIQEAAQQFISDKLPQQLITWNDIYNHITKVLKTNNGTYINQVKPHLVLQHNFFLFFPTIQFIFNPTLNSHIFKDLRMQPCKCPFQKPFSEQQLLLNKEVRQLKQKQSYDINSFESLMMCAPHILNSQILGVDLQGNLRKGGFVEMIQLNNGRNTFLIDIWDMNEKGDFQTFWLARKVLRNVMVNPKVVKIFHDCRHDSIGLHQMIETCIVNVFDTSACQTLIGQLNCYENLFKKEKNQKQLLGDCKTVVGQCTSVRTPGLNDILKKYEARHGINQNKDKYHKMWSKGDISFFCLRPIDPDYREYCIKDVLDLPEVHRKMINSLPQEAVQVAYWVSGLYAQSGYQPE